MRQFTKSTVPAMVALMMVSAHPQGVTPQAQNSSSSEQAQLSQQEHNQQSTFDPQRVSDRELKQTVSDVNKASSFMGMSIQNMQNEKLGTVKDLVFDPETGKVSYAVLSVGGFLGVGDKLIAVPLNSLRAQPGEKYLVVNLTREELKTAPGLAKNNWPGLNDPAFGAPAANEHRSDSSSAVSPASSKVTAKPSSSTTTPPASTEEKAKTSDQLSSPASEDKEPASSASKDGQGAAPSVVEGSSDSGREYSKVEGKDADAIAPEKTEAAQPGSSSDDASTGEASPSKTIRYRFHGKSLFPNRWKA